MTPTSEERREVAARLRNEGRALTAIDMGVELASLTLDDAIGIEHNATWEECFDRLADLIDPTCEIEDAGDVPASVKDNLSTFFCSECGSPIYNDVSPSYCPYCGHRVVSE
jgi:rubrerythrin